jgi:class 3 adenylate cyclase/tetratricopeptide (TPR) repeat protein
MTCISCGTSVKEADRFCASCGIALQPGPTTETRRQVSVLFLDVVGFTELAERLDPEPLRQIMDRYFTACWSVIAEHGGAVEKFIGDAILAVFGAVVVREDDAVRAVRAAAGALDALRDLGAELTASYQVRLEARCGICTGEVVALTTAGGDFRVIGDAVNTASRLQTAARPGEILVSDATAAVVRSRVGVEPVPPLRLKGKEHPVPAWRVTGAADTSDSGPQAAHPFVDRDGESGQLRLSFRRASQGQVCMLTLTGAPGIGKSRLVREFLGALPSAEATVLSGRCSPYGRGITYKPLTEMLSSYPGGWAALAALLDEQSDPSGLAAHSLATIVGAQTRGGTGPPGTEDIAHAVRCLLVRLGRIRPVVIVWEDLHLAEETLLDLIEDVAAWLDDVPVLLLCVARGELLEYRPDWGTRKACSARIELGPLSSQHSTELVTHLAALDSEVVAHEHTGVCQRIAAQCEGNPLFAELLVDVMAEASPSAAVPPTIQALLGARLDQLPAGERRLLELAAVIGQEFTGELLTEMAKSDGFSHAQASELLECLISRRILTDGPGESVRFAQAMLRDTAYAFTSKARRERWHDFLARWFRERANALAMAYHVEASDQIRRQLRPGSGRLPPLAGAAADAFIAEGTDALTRKDLPAAVNLLQRGRELLPAGDRRHATLALHIADAGLWLWDQQLCLSALDAGQAALPGDPAGHAACEIQRGLVTLRLGLRSPQRVAEDAKLIEGELATDDHLSWCRLHMLQAHLHLVAERAAAADACLRQALSRARAMGDGYAQDWLRCAICELARWSSAHLADGLELCSALATRFAANRALLVPVLVTRAHLLALAGELGQARQTLTAAAAQTSELHLDLADAAIEEASGYVASLAGGHEEAEASYRRGLSVLRSMRHAPDTQSIEAAIAGELLAQGRIEDAKVGASAEFTSLRARIVAASVRSRIATARGQHDAAIAEATHARALSSGIDDPCLDGEALFGLAIVLAAAGMMERAQDEAARAISRFDSKGASLLAEQVRSWLRQEHRDA